MVRPRGSSVSHEASADSCQGQQCKHMETDGHDYVLRCAFLTHAILARELAGMYGRGRKGHDYVLRCVFLTMSYGQES